MLNMDFTKSVVLNTNDMDWQGSPAEGVQRKPLAREEAERGHATSVVRYAKGASFDQHFHPKGEEILVLSGSLSDERGRYTAGTWIRNPEISWQHWSGTAGTVVLYKTGHFKSSDGVNE